MRPVGGVPAGLRHVIGMLNAVRVPLVVGVKFSPKELLLKQLNKVSGELLLGFTSQMRGGGLPGGVHVV
jgi:hypothetical protein